MRNKTQMYRQYIYRTGSSRQQGHEIDDITSRLALYKRQSKPHMTRDSTSSDKNKSNNPIFQRQKSYSFCSIIGCTNKLASFRKTYDANALRCLQYGCAGNKLFSPKQPWSEVYSLNILTDSAKHEYSNIESYLIPFNYFFNHISSFKPRLSYRNLVLTPDDKPSNQLNKFEHSRNSFLLRYCNLKCGCRNCSGK